MTSTETLIAIVIHLVIPLAGLLTYLGLVRRMKKEKVDKAPTVDLFFVFATYGGLLLVVLTTLFWKWSGMASLGMLYLLSGAPLLMGIITYRNYRNRYLSRYHKWAYTSGWLYFIITLLTFLVVLVLR